MRRSWVPILALVAALGAGAAVLSRSWPPRPARLLPPADGYVYLDLSSIRRAGALESLPMVEEDPEYLDFMRSTGFRFERDLDEAAFAIHGRIGSTEYPRFSEVFRLRVDRKRVIGYLRKLARESEIYRGSEIFLIPHEGRPVRIAFLDDRTIAISNTDGAQSIHAILDRAGFPSWPAPSALLFRHYRRVPSFAFAWCVLGPRMANDSVRSAPASPFLGTLSATTLIGSLRYMDRLDLRVDSIAQSEDQARRIADQLQLFARLYRPAEGRGKANGSDPDLMAALSTMHMEQQGKRVSLEASFSSALLKKLPGQTAGAPGLMPKTSNLR